MNAAYLAHLAAAALAVHLIRRGSDAEGRILCWALCLVFGGLGAAGFLLGSPGLPEAGPITIDAFLFRPLPGIELDTIDHAWHVLLGAGFFLAAALKSAAAHFKGASRGRYAAAMAVRMD